MGKHVLCMVIAAIALLPVTVQGQQAEKQSKSLKEKLLKFKALGDSMAVKGLDRNYIEQPVNGFAVEVRSTFHQASLQMNTLWEMDDSYLKISADMDNGLNTSAGFWLGYRGIGFGLSKVTSGGKGSNLSLGLAGGNYAANIRINSYRSKMPKLSLTGELNGEPVEGYEHDEIQDAIKVRSLYLDAYYFFNGKRFSYLAAVDQSLIQRRSAGSLVAGAMYYHTHISYSNDYVMALLMQGVGKQKFTQASVGGGYAYNWVPARGWLVSVMAMPMLTFYNRTELDYYELKYIGDKTDNNEIMYEPSDQFESVFVDKEKTSNHIILNYNARLSLVYNWPRLYARVFGHYNYFRYGRHSTSGHLSDWTVYVSLGYRF